MFIEILERDDVYFPFEANRAGSIDAYLIRNWNGREVCIDHAQKNNSLSHLLGMSRMPDRASVSGGYSDAQGKHIEFSANWDLKSDSDNKSSSTSSREKESVSEKDSIKDRDSVKDSEDDDYDRM